MPTAITLKNIPDDIYHRLKAAASAHHRSLNREIIACLEQTLTAPAETAEARLEKARKIRATLKLKKIAAADIRRAIRQGRP